MDDRAAVLLLPFPHTVEERLASKILTALALLLESLLHNVLRSDAGMVCAGKPKGVVAAHPAPADENILNRLVERMAHMQNACHVRRRNDHGIRVALSGFIMEASVVLPERIPLRLCRL